MPIGRAINRSRRFFTLLEMMVGLSLLIVAAGAVSWKIYSTISKKKFDNDVSRIQVQLESCYRLAINTHMDWQFFLGKEKELLVARAFCANKGSLLPFQPKALPLDSLMKIDFNGEEVDKLIVYFSSTGNVAPNGILSFSKGDLHRELRLPEIFQRKEIQGTNGPSHPDDEN